MYTHTHTQTNNVRGVYIYIGWKCIGKQMELYLNIQTRTYVYLYDKKKNKQRTGVTPLQTAIRKKK